MPRSSEEVPMRRSYLAPLWRRLLPDVCDGLGALAVFALTFILLPILFG